jgi:nucleoside phosphorylase
MEGLKNAYGKVVGVEMEGFAILQATAEATAPRRSAFLIK